MEITCENFSTGFIMLRWYLEQQGEAMATIWEDGQRYDVTLVRTGWSDLLGEVLVCDTGLMFAAEGLRVEL